MNSQPHFLVSWALAGLPSFLFHGTIQVNPKECFFVQVMFANCSLKVNMTEAYLSETAFGV
jgi:hypothetical protein